MKMKKKGQVALEFLMTYGWAFLIILVVIGAFVYFDVLNPSQQIAGRCQLNAGIYCNAYQISSDDNEIEFEIRNDKGSRITLDGASIEGSLAEMPDSTGDCGIPTGGQAVPSGEVYTITCEFPDGELEEGERYQGDIEIDYTDRGSSLVQTHVGSISGNIN